MRFAFFAFPLSLLVGSCGLVLDTSPPDVPAEGGVIPQCTSGAQCDDGLFCNGFEDCVEGTCITVGRPQCDDGIACTNESCDEAIDACTHEPSSALCNSNEICDPSMGCRARVFCMLDAECDDGNECTVGERCGDDMFCVFGALKVCPSMGCLHGVCDEETGECGQEPRDTACDDALACTQGECKDDGFCHQERHDDRCGDQWSCTHDVCLGIRTGLNDATGCVHRPQDEVCEDGSGPSHCYEKVCAPFASGAGSTTGCTARVPLGACSDDERCSFGSGVCETLPTPAASVFCDDNDPCNGLETVGLDGMSCVTTGACPESTNSCLESVCVIGIVRGCGFRVNPDNADVCTDTTGASSRP
jgi:hypothetical protein